MYGVRGAVSVDHGVFQREEDVRRLPPAALPALPRVAAAETKGPVKMAASDETGGILQLQGSSSVTKRKV